MPGVRVIDILQLKNKFQTLADAEKHTPPGTSDINTIWEQIRILSLYTDQRSLHAWDADGKRGRSESRKIPGKPS